MALDLIPGDATIKAVKPGDVRMLLNDGTDAGDARKAGKTQAEEKREADRLAEAGMPAANSFDAVAREWHETRRSEWAEIDLDSAEWTVPAVSHETREGRQAGRCTATGAIVAPGRGSTAGTARADRD
jgi:hypothetical protein